MIVIAVIVICCYLKSDQMHLFILLFISSCQTLTAAPDAKTIFPAQTNKPNLTCKIPIAQPGRYLFISAFILTVQGSSLKTS